MDRVLQAYADFWCEPDVGRQRELVDACWSEESEIFGPGYYFKGKKAVLAEAQRFQKSEPGHRIVLTSNFDTHGCWARFTFALLRPDGNLLNEGWDVVQLAEDGLIAKVITFWGKLPPFSASPERPS
jgi:hypothetical protein